MLNREENNEINQTEFVDQAAFIEKGDSLKPSIEEIKKNKNLLPFYILAGVIVFLLLLAFIFSIARRRGNEAEIPAETQQEYQELDPLTQRVKSLQNDLEEADPTRQSLPFPQVDLEFNID